VRTPDRNTPISLAPSSVVPVMMLTLMPMLLLRAHSGGLVSDVCLRSMWRVLTAVCVPLCDFFFFFFSSVALGAPPFAALPLTVRGLPCVHR
jgi:hypothetical protein